MFCLLLAVLRSQSAIVQRRDSVLPGVMAPGVAARQVPRRIRGRAQVRRIRRNRGQDHIKNLQFDDLWRAIPPLWMINNSSMCRFRQSHAGRRYAMLGRLQHAARRRPGRPAFRTDLP